MWASVIRVIGKILDDDKRTPLHWASASKNTELVRYLLSIPTIQVNAQDEVGFRPSLSCVVWIHASYVCRVSRKRGNGISAIGSWS